MGLSFRQPARRLGALLFLAAILLGWRSLRKGGEQAATSPPPHGAAAAPRATAATPPSPLTPADPGPPPPHAGQALPAAIPDRYAGAEVLEERVVPQHGSEGRARRLRLLRTTFKHPLLHVEEELAGEGKDQRLVGQTAYVADHVVIRPRPGVTPTALEDMLKHLGATVRERKPASGIWLVAFPNNVTLDTVSEALAAFAQKPQAAVYAEPDYIVHTSVQPNDSSFSELWGMHNTGQSGGTADADIDAPEAWNLTTGSRGVLVGVTDTGIDATHPDLAANMWTNSNEIPGNGLDDDSNGYVDDSHGWDFVNNDNDPMDDNRHGTHCAGTIGGVGDNGSGVAGVNWQVSLVGLKFLSGSGSGTTSDAVEATAYATSIGVTLTSNSWGGGGFSQALKDAIDAADAAGILFVAAAGNNSSNTDQVSNYPSGYDSANIISVAATTRTEGLASFSNYGAISVDVGAPGSSIYSTVPAAAYAVLNGTSMATPHVAGACALLKAHRPALTHSEIKSLILQSADPTAALAGKCLSGGRLNVYNALLASGDVTMSPGGGLLAQGDMGGPLAPASITYTLTNRDSQAAVWTAAVSEPWVQLSTPGGSIPAGGTASLTVTLTSAVNGLDGGKHHAELTVTNITRGTAQARAVELDILPPLVVSEPLNTNPGWPTTGQWEFGRPLGGGGLGNGYRDPTAGATGTNVFGVNLAGDYSPAPGGPYYVTAGPFNLSQHRNTQLQFQRWLNIDSSYYVGAAVEVSDDGSTWTPVWQNSSGVTDSAWTPQRYDISAVADEKAQVWVRWSHRVNTVSNVWAYSGWNIDDIAIRGVPVKSLAFALPADTTEGDAPTTVTLTVTPVPTAPQTVTLASSAPAQATVPDSITLAAGQASATFDLTPVDDALADGSQPVTITASSAGFSDRAAATVVHDNEARALTLSVPAALTEGMGAVSGQASVGLDTPADVDVRVFLDSSDATELIVPASVVIPAGQSSVAFDLSVPEDGLIDGAQTAVVTASITNWTAAAGTVTISDNEAATLTVTLPASVLEGQAGAAPSGSVDLSGLTPAPLTVALASGDESEVTVPAIVTIPAGQSRATFTLVVVEDNVLDGPQTAAITASASGFTDGTAALVIYDSKTPALPAAPLPADGTTETPPDSDLAWSLAPGTGGTPASFDVYVGTAPALGAGDLVQNTTTMAHALPRLTPGTTYYWQIVSRLGAATTAGPVWSFSLPPSGQVARFAWSPIGTPKLTDELISVTVTAYDLYDDVATAFNGSASVTSQRSETTVVITEVNPNTPDEIEFTNVSSQAVDVSGWKVYIYDVDYWPGARIFTIPAGTECPPGGVFRLQEYGSSGGAYPQFYYGGNINWTSSSLSPVAVLLAKADGTLVDFMAAGAANPGSISQPAAIPVEQWSGSSVSAPTNTAYAYARVGDADTQNAANWTTAAPGLGTLNPGLALPFLGAGKPVAVLPASATFSAGVWQGQIQVRSPAPAVRVMMDDGAGHRGSSNIFAVNSLGALVLAVSSPAVVEDAGSIPGGLTVTLPAPAASDVTVAISSDTPSAVLPATVVIPAGQTSASTPLVAVDDSLLDGTQTAVLEAACASYAAATAEVSVHDNETTTLTLTVPATLAESAGVVSGQAVLSTAEPVGRDVRVMLSSSDPGEVTVPDSVVIPAGESSAGFDLAVVQDTLLDGAQTVTLAATVAGWQPGQAAVEVTDDESAAVTLALNGSTHESAAAGATIGTVRLGGTAVAPVTLTLASSAPAQLTVPATVVIPAGVSYIQVPGSVVDDDALDGTQAVVISASAFGAPAVTGSIQVKDNDAAAFVAAPLAGPYVEGTGIPLIITAKDINGETLPAVAGAITQSAAGDAGALPYQYPASPFVNGVWQQSVRVMAPGTNVRITITGPHATAQSNAFDVTMGPRLALTPPSFTVTTPRQAAKTRTLTLSNTGAQPLSWNISESLAWAAATPASGTVAAGESAMVTVTFDAAALAEGSFGGQLTVTSNDAVSGAVSVPLALTVTGPVAALEFAPVPSPQKANAPFPITLTAKDAGGATVTSFEGSADLGTKDFDVVLDTPVTTGTMSNFFPGMLWQGAASVRNQIILTPAQLSGAGRLTSMSVSVMSGTPAPFTRLTVRLKHTTKAAFTAGGTWEATGWTTVFQGTQTMSGSPWHALPFTVPFDYDGTQNLMVDYSFMNASTGTSGSNGGTYTAGVCWMYSNSAGASGDPLLWSGTEGGLSVSSSQPLLRFMQAVPGGLGALLPGSTTAFVDGVWTGSVRVPKASSNVQLTAAQPSPGTAAGVSNSIAVTTDGVLTVNLAATVSESAGTLDGTVTVTPPPAEDVVLTLDSSVAGAAVPATASVTLPAGASSVPFSLTIVNDSALDGPQTTQISAVGPGYEAAAAALEVADDESAVLTLTLPQETYAEGAGTVTATLSASAAPSVPRTAALASSEPGAATLPASVTLPAGATSVTFPVTIINDAFVDGPQTTTLTAAVPGWTAAAKAVTVTDDEARTLALSGIPASLAEGAAPITGTLALGGKAVADVVITLASSDASALPSLEVTIPAGASSATFSLAPVDDTLADGTQNVTLTASAATFNSATANVAVLDDEVHHFVLSTVGAVQKEGAGFSFTVTAKDVNDVTLTVPAAGPVTLTAAGAGGALPVEPGALAAFTHGEWTGTVRVMAPGTGVRLTVASPSATASSNAFDVAAGPRLAVDPASLAVSVAEGLKKTRTLVLNNTGVEELAWSASTSAALDPVLSQTLEGLNARHAEITALIPNRHDFIDGVTGTYIYSGGNHMYHSGNVLTTSLSATAIPYSDNAIASLAASFGAGGQYFTRKFPGLFVLAADMAGVASFTIDGGTGNHSGLVEGSTLTAARGGLTYQGFVKRARGDVSYGAASINHLVIVASSADAAHSFSSTVDSDNHVVSGLGAHKRLYYLLYSSLSGGNVDDAATQAIFEKFLEVIGAESWMAVSPASGTVPAGGSSSVDLTLSAQLLAAGTYEGGLQITSNDARTSPQTVPVTLTVTPGVHHLEWDAVASPQGVNTPVTATIRAKDVFGAPVTDFEGTASLSALNTEVTETATTGTGTSTTSVPFYTSSMICRTQTIYTSAEAGGAGRISRLSWDISSVGAASLGACTIRLKHTSLSSNTSGTFDNTGWTTVFSGPRTLATGWNEFILTTPFDYNGTDNLMVEVSVVNSTYSSSSYCRYTSSAGSTVYNSSYSAGDPLKWTSGSSTLSKPNLRVQKNGVPAAIYPAATPAFSGGVWTGEVRLGTAGTLELTATTAAGEQGTSNLVTTTAGAGAGTLALALPAAFTEGQGTQAGAGTVSLASAPASPVVILLESLDTSEITVPASVTLPAGQTSVAFDVIVPEDAVLDGPVPVQIRALAVGCPTVSAATIVADNETTTLTLSLPASITEAAYGTATAQGSVTLATPAAEDLVVQLASSTTRLTVPATVIIPAGTSTAGFTLSVPDNTIIDGGETATLTATLAGSPPATGTVQVLDNESTKITVSLFYSSRSEGAAPVSSAGYVYLSGSVTSALTISLASSDTTELTVPATVTVPPGSNGYIYFSLTPVNDTLQDGSQVVTVTASAPGFTDGTTTFTITDDELHHFSLSSVPSPQLRNGPFNVTFTAKAIDDVIISSYAGTPVLTAAEDGGGSLGVTPGTVSGFSGGSKTQSVTVQGYAAAATLTLTDAVGGSGGSNAFAVGAGSLDHFSWDAIASPQAGATPFPVALQARDLYENAITSFTGSTRLQGARNYRTTTSAPITSYTTSYPYGGYYPQNRCQMIYLKSEAGAAPRKLQALAFDMTTPAAGSAGVTLQNLTIRLKHTPLSSYSTSAWDNTGWTTVFQGTVSMDHTGWLPVSFTTPFDYDGTSNLMVDISSSNPAGSYASDTGARSAYSGTTRLLYAFATSSTPPTQWTTTPSSSSTYIPAMRLVSYEAVPVNPAQTAAFTAGAWSGTVAVDRPGTVSLVATDPGSGTEGISNAFSVTAVGSVGLVLSASSVPESSAPLSGTVSLSAPAAADVQVALASSRPAAAAVPASVTVPAGQTSAAFTVTPLRNPLFTGTQAVVISAAAPAYDPGTATLELQDDETSTVSVTLPAALAENLAGGGTGTVTLGGVAGADVVVALASGDSTEVSVLPTVVIPAGASSATFLITPVDDSVIDFDQMVTVTASVPGLAPASATLSIQDNESKNLSLYLSYSAIAEGSGTFYGSVSTLAAVEKSLTISLASSDTTEATVPATVTIPSGASYASFSVTIVDDTEKDGAQMVNITASAAGMNPATKSVNVLDNEVSSFLVSVVPGPQVRNQPFSITITALDGNNATLTNYNGSPQITAQDGATSLAVMPGFVSGFYNGTLTTSVAVGTFATNAVIKVTDGPTGAAGTSNAFAVTHGPMAALAWSTVPSPQTANAPFSATLTAQDSGGNPVLTFDGTAELSSIVEQQAGSGSLSSTAPFYNYSYYTRSQYLYTPAEAGSARTLSGLALNILTPVGTVHNLTIRLKHSSKSSFGSSANTWESSGWTTVFQGTVSDMAAGWKAFNFTTPFAYNGTDNLMVDFSYGDGSHTYAFSGSVQCFGGANRAMSTYTNTSYGGPLGWSGSSPASNVSTTVPNLKLYSATGPAVSPATTGAFTAGVWTGDVTVASGATVMLRAVSGTAVAVSNPVTVLEVPLTVTVPETASEGAGTLTGTVSMAGPQPGSVVVALSSTDSTEVALPASVTIPAGATSASFQFSPVNDIVTDGAQTVTINAAASAYSFGSTTMTVLDDDLKYLSITTTAAATAGVAFPLTVAARTIDGCPATAVDGTTAGLSCLVNGSPATLSPASTTGGFSGHVWSGNATVASTGTAVISATSNGLTAQSAAFPVGSTSAQASRFAISGVASGGQFIAGTAQPITVRAVNPDGTTDTTYSGVASFSVRAPGMGEVMVGEGAFADHKPFLGSYKESRAQVIYKAAQLGGRPMRLSGLALNFATSAGSFTYHDFTLRLKHTAKSSFTSSYGWESGWITVHKSDVVVTSQGWATFLFSAPFDYNGTDNLMVDMSFDNTTTGLTAQVWQAGAGDLMMLFGTANGTNGAPPSWDGTSTPSPAGSYAQPQLRLQTSGGVSVSPGQVPSFASGAWNGSITVQGTAKDLALTVADGAGRTGRVEGLAVVPATPAMDAEPVYTGGTSNTLSWPAVAGATGGYELQAAANPLFSPLLWTQPTGSSTSFTATGLADAVQYFYRHRFLTAAAHGDDVWQQTQWGDFSGDVLSGVAADKAAGSVVLSSTPGTPAVVAEDFNATGPAWSNLFTHTGGNHGYAFSRSALTSGPNTSPQLPINISGDMEGRVVGTYGWCLAADTPGNVFADGSIDGYVCAEAPAAAMAGGLIIRGGVAGSGPSGYCAQVSYGSATSATISLEYASGGTLARFSSPAVVSANDVIRLTLSARGPRITLNAWKVSISGGNVVETPILNSGNATLVVYDSRHASGRAGLRCFNGSVAMLWDDITITQERPVYGTSGTVTSPVIAPAVRQQWGLLDYAASVPAGTALSVSVLDASGNVLAAGVASGTDLNTLPAVAAAPAIKLRAALSTTDTSVTPALHAWSVAYTATPGLLVPSAWSSTIYSVQDARPPVLTFPAAITLSGAGGTLKGTASDVPTGVASVTVNGAAATTTNGFQNWDSVLSGLQEGASTVTITATDKAVPPNSKTVTTTVYRIPDPAQDTNGDGIGALLEHALGIPEAAASPQSMLPATGSQTDPGTGQRFLTMQYRRRIQRAGLTYTVETSDNLTSWAGFGAAVQETGSVPTGDGITELVTVRVTPPPGTTRAYIRLRVTTE